MELFYGKPSTLCWRCANNAGKCCWSKNFTPVEGWEAIPTKIKNGKPAIQRETIIIDSFFVIKCPEFIKKKR